MSGTINSSAVNDVNRADSTWPASLSLDSVGTFTRNHAKFSIGPLLTHLVNFVRRRRHLLMVVMPLNKLAERRARGVEPKTEAPSDEVALLRETRDSMQSRSRAQ